MDSSKQLKAHHIIISQIILTVIALTLAVVFSIEMDLYSSSLSFDVTAGVGLAVLTYLFFAALVKIPNPLQKPISALTNSLVPMFKGLQWPAIAVISLLAGISEELLFRGVMQSPLTEKLGMWPAILITSLIFGAMHALNFVYFALTFFIGLLLGLGYIYSDSLLLVAVWHAVYDFIALTVIVKKPHLLGADMQKEA
ncbi:CPBP family intramembrane glutamic endopeptidase [Thalassotalea agarivorans]|uniref:CAAX prenyl protease 2/Lysostaphin resistance protein A-like domain-containing protein n=1 Tax=Thalassotalea agarivorans TaxID=349064 RepID=A0A1I0E962_THASX|nr:CPBP family intramembrane glutamic endopeptidase [Thalassotalea agarivorans]SET40969.1 hypothetical protein SAMN05660429_01756 [Thalassotalea agarivorans]